MLGLAEAEDAQQERAGLDLVKTVSNVINLSEQRMIQGEEANEHDNSLVSSITYLNQSKLLTPPEERTLALSRSHEGLNFLRNSSRQLLGHSVAVRLRGSAKTSKEIWSKLAEEGINEERDLCAEESVLGRARRGQEVRGVGVGDELGNNAGLGDNVAVVRETGDQTTL